MAKNIGTLVQVVHKFEEQARASRMIDFWSEGTVTQFQEITARLLREGEALQGRERTVNANASWSPTGKFGAVKEAVQAWVNGLGWLRNLIGTLETRLGNNFGELFVLPKSTRNETAQGLRDWELREELRTLGQPERVTMYLTAAEANDVERLRAVQDAPGLTPLIPLEVRLRGDDLRAARLDPARYRAFIETGELLDLLHTITQECDDVAREFGIDTTGLRLTVDELGPKVREAVEFAVGNQSRGGTGKAATRTEPARSPSELAKMVSA